MDENHEDRVECDSCAELVRRNAKVCRFCGADRSRRGRGRRATAPTRRRGLSAAAKFYAVFGVLGVLGFALGAYVIHRENTAEWARMENRHRVERARMEREREERLEQEIRNTQAQLEHEEALLRSGKWKRREWSLPE